MLRPLLSTRLWTAVLLLVGLLVMPRSGAGQSPPANAPADSLIRTGKTLLDDGTNRGSTNTLRQARTLFKQAAAGSTHQALAHYYAALADYRLANQLPDDTEGKIDPILNDAIDHLKKASDLNPSMADAWALLAGCYGQRMGLDPMRSVSLGPKASEAMKKAKDLAPKNPRVWIIDGTSDFFAPSMFGGDKERALRKFNKAAQLAKQESSEDPLRPDWGHAEAYAWIGLAHLNAERYNKARTAFKTALSINPKYGWVRLVLLPRLEKQTE